MQTRDRLAFLEEVSMDDMEKRWLFHGTGTTSPREIVLTKDGIDPNMSGDYKYYGRERRGVPSP